jgi:transcriptional regulator with XRE-family HTH domain
VVDLQALGVFLKSRRDRVRPADVGATAGPRRRVPGLRRDEIAQLAGASSEYYAELERGSGPQPSEQMLTALARALRLGHDERDHFFYLAGRAVPAAGGPADHVHPGMLDLMHRLANTPAQVVTDLRVPQVRNRAAIALLGPPPTGTGYRSSLVYRWFTDPEVRSIYPPEDHADHARSYVADLRAAIARRAGNDAEVTAMVKELRRNPEFVECWDRHDVEFRRKDRKRIVHPKLGLLDVNCLTLFSEDSRQRLIWFTPVVGTESVAKLELLAVIGTQDFS